MKTKTIEIRDRMTTIPALAVQLLPTCEADRTLLARAGYGLNPFEQQRYILLMRLGGENNTVTSDPFHWGDRTMQAAHQHIIDHWGEISSGDVVDVEFILGETDTPKESEGGA